MAQDKKSVLLYCDIIHTVEELNDEEAGKLFKHYLRYINDQNPVAPDKLTQVVFEPIKQNLKRDLKKWESKSKRNSEIAKAGWEKRKEANECERIKQDAKNADKDKVTDTVKEINTQGGEFNFEFVEESFKIPFRNWFKYKTEIKKPFKLQQAIEACYRELKEMSGNHPLEAMKIVQYSISNEYLSLCKPTGKTDKKEEKQVYVPPKKFVHK